MPAATDTLHEATLKRFLDASSTGDYSGRRFVFASTLRRSSAPVKRWA
jgi:hypothetical protein